MDDIKSYSRCTMRVAALKTKPIVTMEERCRVMSAGFLKRGRKIFRSYPMMLAGFAALLAFCSAIWVLAMKQETSLYKPTL